MTHEGAGNSTAMGEVESHSTPKASAGKPGSKLSEQLNYWRRQRTTNESLDLTLKGKISPEPARTIKIRGHETLVIRKPKLSSKLRQQEN